MMEPPLYLVATVMRKPTVRCGLKFCAAGLEVQYNDSLDAIKQRGRNVTGVNFDEHCPASEANYIFKVSKGASEARIHEDK